MALSDFFGGRNTFTGQSSSLHWYDEMAASGEFWEHSPVNIPQHHCSEKIIQEHMFLFIG
jgi:hypothetical protein